MSNEESDEYLIKKYNTIGLLSKNREDESKLIKLQQIFDIYIESEI